MAAYLTDHPPVRDQWYEKRNRPLTGCTVLHTAESIMDSVGPDTGAEAVAEFIRTRTTPGSYHDLCDSDSWVPLIPYEHGAYHDGTGSNNWALSISFACRTSDWRAMSPEKRRGFLRQGARAFAAQQAWRRAHGFPLTDLRLITKAQSDRGESGFTYHGFRDPGRRTDPGVVSPDLFPFDEFLAECRAALGDTTQAPADVVPTAEEHDDMKLVQAEGRGGALFGPLFYRQLVNDLQWDSNKAAYGDPKVINAAQFDSMIETHTEATISATTGQLTALAAQVAGIKPADVDEEALAALLAPKLNGSSQAEITAALREVLRTGVGS